MSAPLIALSGVTLAAAAASATLFRSTLLLSLTEAQAAQAACCSVSAPLIALSGVTLAAAAASATLSINAAALALGSLGGTGRSLLGVCTADRPVGCDARHRSCVGNALDQAASLDFGSLGGTTTRCSVSARLIALSGVTLAAAAASATLSINAAAPALGA